MAQGALPEDPDGTLTRTARVAYRTIAWVLGLILFGAVGGGGLVMALHNSAQAAVAIVPNQQPSGPSNDEFDKLDKRVDKLSDNINSVNQTLATVLQYMKDHEKR